MAPAAAPPSDLSVTLRKAANRALGGGIAVRRRASRTFSNARGACSRTREPRAFEKRASGARPGRARARRKARGWLRGPCTRVAAGNVRALPCAAVHSRCARAP
jgi:hypothetical protein